MAGETVMGGFVWRLGVKSTVKEDLAGAKVAVNDFDNEIKPATESVNKFQGSTKSMMRPLMDMGQGLTAVGMAAFASGTMMGEAGEGYKVAGTALMTVGSSVMLTMPLLKAFSAVMSGEATVALTKFSTLLGITNLQMGALAGGVGIIAVAALWAYTSAQETAKKATEAHKDAMKDAEKATDGYSDALKNLQKLKEEQAGIPKTAEELRDKIKRDQLDILGQEKKLGKGTAAEQAYAQLDYNEMNRRLERDTEALNKLRGRKGALPGEISTATTAVSEAEWNKNVLGIIAREGPYKGPANLIESTARGVTPMMGSGTQYDKDLLQGTFKPTFQIGPINGTFNGQMVNVTPDGFDLRNGKNRVVR